MYTFLALARAFVRCAQNSEVSLRVVLTRLTKCQALQILIVVAKAVAANAAELPLLGLEEAYKQTFALHSFARQHEWS
jgi:hypothetical protein